MIIQEQKIFIKWNSKNKKYYEEKGYKYTKMKEPFEVDIKDLALGSDCKIKIKCDYCGDIFINKYKVINKQEFHSCLKCSSKKRKRTCIEKYGVDNPAKSIIIQKKIRQTNLERYEVEVPIQNEKIHNKIKQTCIKKYGVDNPIKLKKVRDKITQTNLKKYGVNNVFKCKKIRDKIVLTNLKRYGVDNVSKNNNIREKMKRTCIEKYGVDNPWKNEFIHNKCKEKANITMYKNGTAPCSKPQKYIYELLNNLSECKLNYPIGKLWLDIAYPEEMIYIEYDGAGHDKQVKCGWKTQEEFNKNERQRQYYLKSKGWKLIRILSNDDKLPSDEKIIELINECKDYLLNTDHTWIKIDLNNNKIECKEFIKSYIYC